MHSAVVKEFTPPRKPLSEYQKHLDGPAEYTEVKGPRRTHDADQVAGHHRDFRSTNVTTMKCIHELQLESADFHYCKEHKQWALAQEGVLADPTPDCRHTPVSSVLLPKTHCNSVQERYLSRNPCTQQYCSAPRAQIEAPNLDT